MLQDTHISSDERRQGEIGSGACREELERPAREHVGQCPVPDMMERLAVVDVKMPHDQDTVNLSAVGESPVVQKILPLQSVLKDDEDLLYAPACELAEALYEFSSEGVGVGPCMAPPPLNAATDNEDNALKALNEFPREEAALVIDPARVGCARLSAMAPSSPGGASVPKMASSSPGYEQATSMVMFASETLMHVSERSNLDAHETEKDPISARLAPERTAIYVEHTELKEPAELEISEEQVVEVPEQIEGLAHKVLVPDLVTAIAYSASPRDANPESPGDALAPSFALASLGHADMVIMASEPSLEVLQQIDPVPDTTTTQTDTERERIIVGWTSERTALDVQSNEQKEATGMETIFQDLVEAPKQVESLARGTLMPTMVPPSPCSSRVLDEIPASPRHAPGPEIVHASTRRADSPDLVITGSEPFAQQIEPKAHVLHTTTTSATVAMESMIEGLQSQRMVPVVDKNQQMQQLETGFAIQGVVTIPQGVQSGIHEVPLLEIAPVGLVIAPVLEVDPGLGLFPAEAPKIPDGAKPVPNATLSTIAEKEPMIASFSPGRTGMVVKTEDQNQQPDLKTHTREVAPASKEVKTKRAKKTPSVVSDRVTPMSSTKTPVCGGCFPTLPPARGGRKSI